MSGKTSGNGVGMHRSGALTGAAAARGLPLALMSILVAVAVTLTWATGALADQDTKDKRPSPQPIKIQRGAPPAKEKIGQQETQTGTPVLKVDNMVHDFGVQWVGPMLRHTFRFTNEGDGPLTISKVQPACGCTVGGNYPTTIAAGETGEFPFSIRSDKMYGPFDKSITVSSNDPASRTIKLNLVGEVKRYVDVSPRTANFLRIASYEPHERVLTLQNNTEEPLVLTLPPAKVGDQFTYQLIEKTPGKVFELHVRTAPPFTPGRVRQNLTLATNLDQRKNLDIVVAAIIPERLDVQPKAITIHEPKGRTKAADEPVKRSLRLTNYGQTPVKVLEGTVDNPGITVTVTEDKPGKLYNIELQVPPSFKPPIEGNLLTLKTDDPDSPTLTVPIRKPAPRVEPKRDTVRPAKQMEGKPTPKFSFETLDGKSYSDANLADHPAVVLNFVAPNCGYCKRQLANVKEVRAEYEAKGVRFINVVQKMRQEFAVEDAVKVFEATGAQFEFANDMKENKVGKLFKVSSFPTMVVLGNKGMIEAVNMGAKADIESMLKRQLDAIITDKSVPRYPTTAQKSKTRPSPTELVGKPAPTFSFETLDGKAFSNAELVNHPATVLNFVAPNCGYCKKQLPVVEAIRKEYEAKGVRFFNVAQQMRQEFAVEDAVKVFDGTGAHLEFANDMKENKVGKSFKATGFPTMVVLGKNGKVEAVNIGATKDLDTTLKGQLDQLIAGKSPSETPVTPQPSPIKIRKVGEVPKPEAEKTP